MPEKSKTGATGSRRQSKKSFRRPLWKRLLRRGSNEDKVEYVSRLVVGPLFVVTLVLVIGLTVEPEGRKAYIENVVHKMTAPFTWIADQFSGTEASASGSTPLSRQPVDSRAPAPALFGSSVQYDSTGTSRDTSASGVASVGDGSEGSSPVTSAVIPAEGTWYVVKNGEWLVDIARSFYGDVDQWRRVWLYNLERLPKPDQIRAGMELFIPPPGVLTEAEAARIRQLLGESA